MADAELALVNKVDFKIVLADTDQKLSTLLNTFLPPLLLKLASPHAAVRSKVIEICQHIGTRIKSEYVCLTHFYLLLTISATSSFLSKSFWSSFIRPM